MTVILKDIPGVTARELLETLHGIRPDRPIATGHGGFVIDEETALDFLQAYLIMTGKRAPLPAPEPTPEPDPTPEPELATKRRTPRKGASQ